MTDPQAADWRPIACAPPDQGSILAVHEGSGIMAVSWRKRSGAGPVYLRYADDEGWRPTHWMPCPMPPRPTSDQ